MSKKQKRMLYRIIVTAILLLTALLLEKAVKGVNETVYSAFYLVAYITIGYDVITKAVLGLRYRRFADENLLMSVASIGAVALGEFTESVAVMLLYQIGELLQSLAVGKSRKSISELLDVRPYSARVIRKGEALSVMPEEVQIGEIIEVLSGEKIALDGMVISGNTQVDNSSLTGESLPVYVGENDSVLAGGVNLSGVIRIRVTKPFSECAISKIKELMESASSNKAKSEKFITKFARWYTPTVLILAILLAIIPQFFVADGLVWVKRALIFLVISCPCALVISVPLTFFGGMGCASSKGILIKGSGYMETLSKSKIFVFDKTGTLTKGSFKVVRVNSEKLSSEILLAVCAAVEQYSNHPIAQSIVSASKEAYKKYLVSDVREFAGLGITARVENVTVSVGNSRFMERLGISCEGDTAVVHIALGREYGGNIVLCDEIKEETANAVKELKELNIKETAMLTGDSSSVAEEIAQEAGIDRVYSSLLPEDKVEILEEIMRGGEKTVYVGDGINDAPVIRRADVGVAMGAFGSEAAIESADIVLMDDNPEKLVTALRISRKTCRIAKQNIIFALCVKALFLLLGALGVAGMVGAVFADVGVAFIAILNAMRSMRVKTVGK